MQNTNSVLFTFVSQPKMRRKINRRRRFVTIAPASSPNWHSQTACQQR